MAWNHGGFRKQESGMGGKTKVTIIIPNLNSPTIDRVLDVLTSRRSEGDRGVEILVVGLDEPGLVRVSDRVRFISTGRPVSPARARNIGAASATGRILIFLDADCIPSPGWLKEMLAASDRWKDAGAISGSMLPDGRNYASQTFQIACFHEHLSLNKPGCRRLLASFSLLITREVWEKTGGFCPDLQIAEDVDLSVRLQKMGYPLYLASRATVRHLHGRDTLSRLWHYATESGRHSIRVRLRHQDWFGSLPASAWFWRLFAPAVALVRTVQIYRLTPGLLHFWVYFPYVLLSKLGWCIGAARGIEESAADKNEE